MLHSAVCLLKIPSLPLQTPKGIPYLCPEGRLQAYGVRIHVDISWSCPPNVPSCSAPANNIVFLWGAAHFPLGIILTGLSIVAWFTLYSDDHTQENIQASPPHASRTDITIIRESRANTWGVGWGGFLKGVRAIQQHHLSFCHSWGLGFSDTKCNHPLSCFVEKNLGCVCLCPQGPEFNRVPGRAVLSLGLSRSTETWNHGLMKPGSHRDALKCFCCGGYLHLLEVSFCIFFPQGDMHK